LAPAVSILPVLWLAARADLAGAQEPLEQQGVRIGITYTPGVRPGMIVLSGARDIRIDSIRAIVRRDLDYSDQFELISLPGGDSVLLSITDPGGDRGSPVGQSRGGAQGFVNYSLYAALGADFAVAVTPGDDPTAVDAVLFDVGGQSVRHRVRVPLLPADHIEFRMTAHRAADELVRAASGQPGFAASRLLFLQHGRVSRIDSDGGDLRTMTPANVRAFSPAWAPTGGRFVYTELTDGRGRLVLQDVRSGWTGAVPGTERPLNYAAQFSPDGESLAFARSGEDGTDIYRYNVARDCCLERLTVGRFADNLSPTFSPDGRQVAFVSTRAGGTQIYVMSADGTGQELFAPYDYGVTGSSYAPEWSPDGTKITFHRDVAGSPQVFVMETRSRVVRQLTSAGRNEDPTWAPDGRHIAFVSDRTGRRQIWVIDIETGRVRQLTTVGDARLPSWSPRIAEAN
jgi:TolB protein